MSMTAGQRLSYKHVKRQITLAKREIQTWPNWMRRAIKSHVDAA